MGPQDPRLSSPTERERSAAKDKGTGAQYVAVCSVSNSPLTHNPYATISDKVWEVYFSKEVCSFVIIVDFVYACICICITAMQHYMDAQLTKRLEKKLDGNYTRMLRGIMNKSWRQHPTKHQLYGHLPLITKTIQVRRTRHARLLEKQERGHKWYTLMDPHI